MNDFTHIERSRVLDALQRKVENEALTELVMRCCCGIKGWDEPQKNSISPVIDFTLIMSCADGTETRCCTLLAARKANPHVNDVRT